MSKLPYARAVAIDDDQVGPAGLGRLVRAGRQGYRAQQAATIVVVRDLLPRARVDHPQVCVPPAGPAAGAKGQAGGVASRDRELVDVVRSAAVDVFP